MLRLSATALEVLGLVLVVAVATRLEFGLPVFIVALMIAMVRYGMKHEEHGPGEKSAWSVFNEGVEQLPGTFRPAHEELLAGPSARHPKPAERGPDHHDAALAAVRAQAARERARLSRA